MKRIITVILVIVVILSSFASCDQKTKETATKDTACNFTSYDAIINTYQKMIDNCINYDESTYLSGGYYPMFDFVNDTERKWHDTIFKSLLTYRESNRSAYGYSIGDINNDGTAELLLMLQDDTLFAIFSKADDKPVLLNTFWPRNRGYIDQDGMLHIQGNNGASGSSHSIYKISSDCNELEPTLELGRERFDFDTNEDLYYRISNTKKEYISQEEYENLHSSSPFFNGNISSKDNKGVEFISLFSQ